MANTQEMIESSSQSLLACEGHSDRGRMELSPSNVGILQACAFVCLYPLIIRKTAKGSDQHGSVGTFAHSARPENSARSHKPRGRDAIAKPLRSQCPRGLMIFISSECPIVTPHLAADSALGCMSRARGGAVPKTSFQSFMIGYKNTSETQNFITIKFRNFEWQNIHINLEFKMVHMIFKLKTEEGNSI